MCPQLAAAASDQAKLLETNTELHGKTRTLQCQLEALAAVAFKHDQQVSTCAWPSDGAPLCPCAPARVRLHATKAAPPDMHVALCARPVQKDSRCCARTARGSADKVCARFSAGRATVAAAEEFRARAQEELAAMKQALEKLAQKYEEALHKGALRTWWWQKRDAIMAGPPHARLDAAARTLRAVYHAIMD